MLSLTYIEFHLIFILPLLVILAVSASSPLAGRPYAGPAGIGLLAVIAVVYTTPWDSHLVDTGVWTYGTETVLMRIWHVPIEEYLFFVLQPLVTGLWLTRFETVADREFGIPLGYHALGCLAGGLVSGVGLLVLSESTYYLSTLLIWAGLPLAIQWGFGWPVLWELRRTLIVGIVVPTVYLCIADRIAITTGIWTFDEQYLTEIAVLGLPIEEILFFLLTNLFIVQGLLLFWWVTDRQAAVRTRWQHMTDRWQAWSSETQAGTVPDRSLTASTTTTTSTTTTVDPSPTLDDSLRATITRVVLWPGWLCTAIVIVPFALGLSIPLVVQTVPLVASVVILGLPHGAVDHLAIPRVRGKIPTRRALSTVLLVYTLLGSAYAVLWFLAPARSFVFFLIVTWLHWGQGDLYAILAFLDADYLGSRFQRVLTVVVRGGLPMIGPLLFFPDTYRRVAMAFLDLFAGGSIDTVSWLFRTDTRLALGVGFGTVVLGTLGLGFVRSSPDNRSAWLLDAGETVLLAVYFSVVPPLFAIGLYFCVWHSLRHIARLVLLDDDARATLSNGHAGPAFVRFAREATPLTLGALVLLAGLYLFVPNKPGDPLGLIALYLVLIASLTLPHVAVVTVMDREQPLWG